MIDKARIKSAVDAAAEALSEQRLNGTDSSARGMAIAQLAGQIVLGEKIEEAARRASDKIESALKLAAEIGRGIIR